MAAMRSVLEELKDDELKSLTNASRVQAAVAVFESLIEERRLPAARCPMPCGNADNSLDALLEGRFRTENELHRGGVPRPEHFDARPKLRALQLPDFDTAADEAGLRQQSELVERLLAEAQQIRASIQESFSQQFDRLKPLVRTSPERGCVVAQLGRRARQRRTKESCPWSLGFAFVDCASGSRHRYYLHQVRQASIR